MLPKRPVDFSPNISSTMIAALINLNTGKWKERDVTGGLLPALSMLLVASVTTESSFPKKNYPCMRWSTKWKSPWDTILNTVNGTKRRAERSSSVSWKKFKTSQQRLHYCRHRSRRREQGWGPARCYSPINVCR